MLTFIRGLWPVDRCELKKVLPILFMKFLVSMVYSGLNCLKDSLIVPVAGAEVIPVLKGGLVLPISFLFTVVYAKCSNHFKRSTIFYIVLSLFIAVVFSYSFILFPNVESLIPYKSSAWLQDRVPQKYWYIVMIYKYWVHSLFFITSEMWAVAVIFILYWGFVNHVCVVGEAKRIYTLFIAAGDVATIGMGVLSSYYASTFPGENLVRVVQSLSGFILLAAVMVIVVYWWMHKFVLSDVKFFNPDKVHSSLDGKTRLSVMKSLKYLFSSKYLMSLAALVIGYGLTSNLVEVSWKANLNELCKISSDYMVFTSKMSAMIGLLSLIVALFVSGGLLRKFGWTVSALISPLSIGVTGVGFFILACNRSILAPVASLFNVTPLYMLVLLGCFQVVTSKVVKYSFFDYTKEMAYIPLDHESKVKGKAAVEASTRLGKSGASWINMVLMWVVGSGSIISITAYLIPIVCAVTAWWVYATVYIGSSMDRMHHSGGLDGEALPPAATTTSSAVT